MPEHHHLRRRTWFLLGVLVVGWLVLDRLGSLDFVERRTEDWRFKVRGEIPSPLKVSYVDVDSRSISDLGNQPWDRAYFAEVSRALLLYGKAKAVGIDYVFSDNGVPDVVDHSRFDAGRRILAGFLNGEPPPKVVVAASYASPVFRDVNSQLRLREFPLVGMPEDQIQPPELPEFHVGPFLYSAPHVGLIDTIDGDTRAVHAYARLGTLTWYHMAFELARLYWDASSLELAGGKAVFTTPSRTISVPLQRKQDLDVNWFSAWDSKQNPHSSFSWALVSARAMEGGTPSERQAAEAYFSSFEGAVVLIGPVDPLLHDLAPTPFDAVAVPRVGIHGNLLKTIVSGKWIRRLPPLGEVALFLLLPLAVAWLAFRRGVQSATWRVFGGLLIVVYALLCFVLFSRADWMLPLAGPSGAALSVFVAGIAVQLISEERQKKRIQGLFGTYLSPELVSRMVASNEEPRLGGEEVQLTAYFSDIQSFTTLSESLAPRQLVELMNEYLTACTDCLTQSGGTLDKYIGDGVVAMFGAPVRLQDHAFRACLGALSVQRRLGVLRGRWAEQVKRWPGKAPEMRTRIGLASGPVVVGNMGSQTRFNYTMTGDTVNLAARLESLSKYYGVEIMVADETRRECCEAGGNWLFRKLDVVAVVGRSSALTIWELVEEGDGIQAGDLALVESVDAAWKAYDARDWVVAAEAFEKAAGFERRQGASVSASRLLAERCRRFAAEGVPEGWSGVWVHAQK